MALQGRARGVDLPSHAPLAKAPDIDYNYRSRKTTTEQNEKQSYTWLKDLYNFASANKDNLNDPDVQDIINQKMQKLEATGFFSRSPRRMTSQGLQDQGQDFQVAQPEQEQERILRDISQLQQRFMMEHPSQYGPTEKEVMGPQGYGQYQFDPIHGNRFLGQSVAQVPEGSGLFTINREGKSMPLLQRARTTTPSTPSDLEQAWSNYNKRNPNAQISMEEFKTKHWEKQTEPKETGKLTEYQKLNILNDVENQIAKMKNEKVEITQDDIDRWNRQLEGAGRPERISLEEVVKPGWIWDTKEKQVKVGISGKKSLADIWGK